jgi:hypothetical protein
MKDHSCWRLNNDEMYDKAITLVLSLYYGTSLIYCFGF